jgi:hypothetical protein
VRHLRGSVTQDRLTERTLRPYVRAPMRGRRRTLASVLAESLASRGADEPAAVAVAFAEACGPRLAREASCRGVMRDGRLLVLVRTPAWAAQIETLAPVLCARVNERLGRPSAAGLDVRVASVR